MSPHAGADGLVQDELPPSGILTVYTNLACYLGALPGEVTTVSPVPRGDHLPLRAARLFLRCVSLKVFATPTRRYHGRMLTHPSSPACATSEHESPPLPPKTAPYHVATTLPMRESPVFPPCVRLEVLAKQDVYSRPSPPSHTCRFGTLASPPPPVFGMPWGPHLTWPPNYLLSIFLPQLMHIGGFF